MVYLDRPEGFNQRFEIVSCFLEHNGKFLVMLRQEHKPQGNTWGVPAGKVEDGESQEEGMVRELEEETGLKVQPEMMRLAHTVYVRYPEYDFTYHIFHHLISEPCEIVLDSSAHKEYRWVSPQEALEIPLVPDQDRCVKLFYNLT